jgi:hypothetical protein
MKIFWNKYFSKLKILLIIFSWINKKGKNKLIFYGKKEKKYFPFKKIN